MKTVPITVLFTFLFLPAILFSQITIDGSLRLGDSTQILLLQTRNGDQLVGTITSWDADSLSFKLTSGDTLGYGLGDLVKIKVYGKPLYEQITDFNNGLFNIRSDDGKERNGYIIKMGRKSVRIKYGRKRRAYIATQGLQEAAFDPTSQDPRFENSYMLRLKDEGTSKGRLVHIDREFIHFQPKGSKAVKYPRSKILLLDQRNGYRPMIGHQRTLLLTPTGFNLRKGESEFRNIDYFLNSFSTGFTDNLSGTIGLLGIEPYLQLKVSHDFGRLLHFSAGGGVALGGATGWQAAASLGTPDLYLNMGFMQSKGETTINSTDMHAVFFGGSMRVGDHQRLLCEFTMLTEKRELLDANGAGTNTFAVAYGWYGKRFSLNVGLMRTEYVDKTSCFGSFGIFPCNEEVFRHVVVPIISTSVYFGKRITP